MNYSLKCWTVEHQLLSGSALEMILFALFFPPICILGIAGNILNLMVLLSPKMKSRSNTFLACLAFCDIVFLVLMIPHSLANFNTFALNYYFRWYYLSTKIHLITLANWSSAVAIWLVIAVCVDRVIGIKYPFKARGHWSRSFVTAIIVFIVLIAGLLTFYNHFSHVCIIREFCNRSQVMAKCFDVTLEYWPGNRTNIAPLRHRNYVKWSIFANAIFVVIIPIIILTALNVSLIIYVRRGSFASYQNLIENEKHTAENYSGQSQRMLRRNTEQVQFQKTEHRLAITVCAIVTCFTITQGPSAIVLSINSFSSKRTPHGHPEMGLRWYHLHTITSFLVIVGKALNFILFCLSSANFRRNLAGMIRSKMKQARPIDKGERFASFTPWSVKRASTVR